MASQRMRKPERGIFHAALRVPEVEPNSAVLVDDTEANLVAARSVDMSAVHFRTTQQAVAELTRLDMGPRPARSSAKDASCADRRLGSVQSRSAPGPPCST